MCEREEFEEFMPRDDIDWGAVRSRLQDWARDNPDRFRASPGWEEWALEYLKEVWGNPYHRGREFHLEESDIVFALEIARVLVSSYSVRLGRGAGPEITLHGIKAVDSDEAADAARRTFSNNPEYAAIRGDDAAEWSVYGVD
jgi:hypothetical protein